jgi:hypothetical protein
MSGDFLIVTAAYRPVVHPSDYRKMNIEHWQCDTDRENRRAWRIRYVPVPIISPH